jgi:hypothetical protein
MFKDWFGKKSNNKSPSIMDKAKQDFENACNLNLDNKQTRGLKIKIALRCRAVIDIIFIDGAKTYEKFAPEKLEAIWNENQVPDTPEAENFQSIKSSQGEIIGYIPIEHANKIFLIGGEFQTKKISKITAIRRSQLIANEISLLLNVENCFHVLDFLRD